ncbi:glutamate-1-semialdehyde 2,1-aminomutase [Legionella sp. W05-934-2]|jgi:glutamate-1-semialdehyde 2,1-aminomutase|uniref:glutamate-1-semialdehyde 2,1-aminomutase n=1 Tax=Legionella sp. W05-934-2 TaxID=1198649 RepID=UPI0034635E52
MSNSERLFELANQFIPGGVNSPVRAFKGVGGCPIFFRRGEGCRLTDVDGTDYIDYVGSWGPLILGHSHPKVITAVQTALANGMSFGAPTELEIELAQKVIEIVPSIEKVRMVSSGTEATMTAIRLARGYTGKNKIIKLNGCYHGHSDSLLVKAGSGVLTLGIPATPGIPDSITEHTLTADFNDLNQIELLFKQYGDDIAGIILEPVAGNMGLVLPAADYLQGLRAICDQYQSLLIFDEVMCGFRVALEGAQGYYNVTPDLTTLGKVIGGGMPVGAIGGSKAIMDHLAPVGPVYQAGTLSGNPLAMAAGLATLKEIQKPGFFENLTNSTNALVNGLMEIARRYNLPFYAQSIGGMFGFYFANTTTIRGYDDVAKGDSTKFKSFFHGMLAKGVYFAPSMFEAGFVSQAHTLADIEETLAKADTVMANL